jgi:hypothetical protein
VENNIKYLNGGNIMSLKSYFENKEGLGVLATSDNEGKVNTAIYARPHLIDEKTLIFTMCNNRSFANLNKTNFASYLFKENGDLYQGKRLLLRKIKETMDNELYENIHRKNKCPYEIEGEHKEKYLVYFEIDEVRPLVGSG